MGGTGKGIADVVVGYSGGNKLNPTYRNIMDATEAVLVEFNPELISYEDILDEWARMHEPYYPSGTQYRSAIFYRNEEQQRVAMAKVDSLGRGGEKKVYVDVEPVSAFYRGEEYHQDFLEKQSGSRTLRF